MALALSLLWKKTIGVGSVELGFSPETNFPLPLMVWKVGAQMPLCQLHTAAHTMWYLLELTVWSKNDGPLFFEELELLQARILPYYLEAPVLT